MPKSTKILIFELLFCLSSESSLLHLAVLFVMSEFGLFFKRKPTTRLAWCRNQSFFPVLDYIVFSSKRAIKVKPCKQMSVSAACIYVEKVILLLLVLSLIKLTL